jgi:hypothetical protein
MKRLLPVCCLFAALPSWVALAQQPMTPRPTLPLVTKIDRPPVAGPQQQPPASTHFTPAMLSAPATTPELWVYSQEQRRHDDPAQAVRRKAEFQADQRMARIAALKRYGYSNSRPEAGMTPIMGTYSAGWAGNGWNRYEWFGGGSWWR